MTGLLNEGCQFDVPELSRFEIRLLGHKVTLQLPPTMGGTIHLRAEAFPGEDTARAHGERMRTGLRLAAVHQYVGLLVARDQKLGGAGKAVIDYAAERGCQLLPHVLGLQVFKETGEPMMLTGSATGHVIRQHKQFIRLLEAGTGHADLPPTVAPAADLLLEARFLRGPGKLLLLISSLEALCQREYRPTPSRVLLAEFRQAANGLEDRDEAEALLSALSNLERESISAAVRRQARDVAGDEAVKLVKSAYKLRHPLTHGDYGLDHNTADTTTAELENLVRQLTLHVAGIDFDM